MNNFSDCLLRLKKALGVSKDIEIAEQLGLSKTAFAERKRRGAFPDRELRALVLKRPELRIDADYVLTGVSAKTKANQMLQNFGPRLVEVRGDRTPVAFAKQIGVSVKDLLMLEAGQRPPTTDEVLRLQKAHPHKSAIWLFGGDAPKLDQQLDDLEVIFLENYRACTDDAKEALRQQAAFYASLNN